MNKEIEKKLWEAANALRGNLSAEEYMHIILGILSLKYISDRYDSALIELKKNKLTLDDVNSDMFYYNYEAFIVSGISHWKHIMNFANSNDIGEKMDEAFLKLEADNPMLKGIFNKDYNSEKIDQHRLGEVIKIFSDEDFTEAKEDIIGRIYEYFLGKFFKDRGQKGGEFYTPTSIVKIMVHFLQPLKGRIYDPACGTGGIIVQSKKYILEHGGKLKDITVFGQEFNNVTWKLAKLNLILNNFSIKDVDGNCVLGNNSADTFRKDQHKDKKFDFVMANPPFNCKKWGSEYLKNDSRWKWGLPPKGNANYAWISHMISKLSDKGKAAIVLANGSLSSNSKQELEIRKNLLKDNMIDAIIALPAKLFYTVGIPACIWIFNKKKINNDILMIHAVDKGKAVSKKLSELTQDNVDGMTNLYLKHLEGSAINVEGFAKTINFKELEDNDFSLVPGRYVDLLEEIKPDKKEIKKKIKVLSQELKVLFQEMKDLNSKVENSLEKALEFEEDAES